MSLPAYINSSGLITKIFDKIIEAGVPERYTVDFQETVLGYGSGSARPFIPFLKRLGFLTNDGKPTDLYKRFRNNDSRGTAMAEAMRAGYSDIFMKNQFSWRLTDDKLRNLIVELTGRPSSDGTISAIVSSFKACKTFADFETLGREEDIAKPNVPDGVAHRSKSLIPYEERHKTSEKKINLSYTINLNLPETTDVEVFNAIFSALRNHLLEE